MNNEALPQEILTPAEAVADGLLGPLTGGAESQGHRNERGRRLKLSIVSALVTKPLAVLVPFITFPLFLKYLGEERYGLFAAVSALAMWLGLTNAGLGLGLVNQLADCYVSGNRDLARRYVSSLTLALFTIALVSTLLLAVVTPLVNWRAIFEVNDPVAIAEVPWAVFFAGAATLLGIWVSLPSSIYMAYQELHRNNLWDAATRVVSLLACFAVVYTNWGIVGVIIASAGMGGLVRLVNLIWMFIAEKPWLRPRIDLFDFQLLRRVMAEGICFFVLQMAVMALFQTDTVIIGIVIKPSEVVPYSALGRLFLCGYGLFMLILSPLWPAHAEALRRGDLAWVRRMLRNSLVMGCGTILLLGAVLFFFGRPIVHFWARQDVEFSRSLVLAMTSLFVLRAWVDCRSVVLNSAGTLVPQMIFFAAHAIANLVLAVILARRWGVEGVAWATVITSLLTSAWGYPWMMRRYIWRQPERFIVKPA